MKECLIANLLVLLSSDPSRNKGFFGIFASVVESCCCQFNIYTKSPHFYNHNIVHISGNMNFSESY